MRDSGVHARDIARFLAAMIALTFAPMLAVGQQAAAEQASQSTLASFVSRLKAEAVDYQVKLTWKDSPDIKGTCRIYRLTEEITEKSFGQAALIGRVDSGVEYYIDTPPDRAGYYYAVLIQDTAGTLYPLLIPFRNRTSTSVAALTTAPEEKLAAHITAIKAAVTATGDGVEVTFVSSNPGRDLLLFWSSAPLAVPEDLLRSTSTTQLDPGATRYIVPALPGLDYWFALLDAGMYKLGQAVMEKGMNATADPVHVPVGSSRASLAPPAGARRATPLPSLSLAFSVQTGQQISRSNVPDASPEKKISPATAQAISKLLQQIPRPSALQRMPQVLPSDATPMPGSELGRLVEIVQGPFIGGDTGSAQKLILAFLSLPRSAELEARARFYLGQTYYLQGRAREALMEFLLSEDFFYQYVGPWLDACYQDLEKADQ